MHTKHFMTASRRKEGGFTIVEVTVVVIVLAVLTAIIVDSSVGYQTRARDSERAVDIDIISRSLERYYRTQAVATGASYPPTATGASGIATIADDADAVKAPNQTGNSVVIASNGSAQTPTIAQYIYQPLTINGSLCTATPCVRYKLYYRTEVTDTVVVVDSVRQQ